MSLEDLRVKIQSINGVFEIVNDEGHESFLVQLKAEQIIPLLPQELVVLAKLHAQPPQFERTLNPDHELGGPDGLRQKVVTAGAERAIEGIDIALGGEKEN